MKRTTLLVPDDGLPRGVFGAADAHFVNVVGIFSRLFPGRRFGGRALCVYIDGLGYNEMPVPGLLAGFGHVGLDGTLGWADPASGSALAFVHNQLLTPLLFDMGSFAGLAGPLRKRHRERPSPRPAAGAQLGAPYAKPARRTAAAGGG